MTQPVHLSLGDDGIATLAIDRPPVNAMSLSLVEALADALVAFERMAGARALLVVGAGRCFMAGADLSEFDRPAYDTAPLHALYRRLEDQPRPVAVCWHGTALGAGLELGLAAHYRLALAGSRLGLPEVRLGLLPGGHGTQRLPRLVGVSAALQLMLGGEPVDADRALALGLVDAVLPAEVPGGAAAWLRRRLAEGLLPPRPTRRRPLAATAAEAAILASVQAGLSRPFDDAVAVEAAAFDALRRSPASQALRAEFFAQRQRPRAAG
jgi:3-hydroxyacyl-CoA dehydrogenase